MATVVQVQNFEENVDLGLGYSQGAVSLAVLILGVEVLDQGLELLLVQVTVLVHVVLDRLHVSQEVLEGHELGETHSARLQVCQLSVHPRDVLGELRVGQENQQTPSKVLPADKLSRFITLILAEIIVPELLSNFTSELIVFFFSNGCFAIKNLFSNLFVCVQKVFVGGFYMATVHVT